MVFWSLWVYRYGIFALPRQDHYSFMFDRALFHSDWDYFWHIISFTKTRTTFPGDYYLFRPATHGFLALIDIFYRDNLYTAGKISILWHGFASFFLYLFTSKYSGKKIGFLLALIFVTQYPGLEMIIWRHVSPYILGLLFFTFGLLIFSRVETSGNKNGVIAASFILFLFSGFFFESMIFTMTVAFLIFLALKIGTKDEKLKTISSNLMLVAFLVVAVYTGLYIFEYVIRNPPSFLGPADTNASTFTWLDTVYSLATISGLLFTAFLFPHIVNIYYESVWHRAWWDFFATGTNFFYSWLGVFCGIVLIIVSLKGVWFLFRRSCKASGAVFILVLIYFGIVAAGLSLGRASLRSVSYMINSTYYYYMASYLLTMIAALSVFIVRQSGVFQQLPGIARKVLWFLFILLSVHQVALSYEQIQKTMASRYDFDKQVAEATFEVAKKIKQNQSFCFGGSVDRILEQYLLTELLYRESCYDKEGVGLYAGMNQSRSFWLAKFKKIETEKVMLDFKQGNFEEKDGLIRSISPTRELRVGQAMVVSDETYVPGLLSVTIRHPINGGIVVGYKDPDNFMFLAVRGNNLNIYRMYLGRLSEVLSSHQIHPVEQLKLSIRKIGTNYFVFYNQSIITKLEVGQEWIGKVGLYDAGDDSGRQAFSELKIADLRSSNQNPGDVDLVFKLRLPILEKQIAQEEQGWAVATS